MNCLTAASSGEGKYPGVAYANYVPFLEGGGRGKDELSGEVEGSLHYIFFKFSKLLLAIETADICI